MKLTYIPLVPAIFMLAARLSAQDVTIDVNLLDPPQPNTYYQLAGQSAYIQFQSGGATSGGQLDGISSGLSSIQYTDVFPPASISEYERFAYFGLVKTISSDDDTVLDTSFVMAYTSVVISPDFEDWFPGFVENDVVNDLASSFDSPTFFTIINTIFNGLDFQGAIELPELGITGDTMPLIAFQTGPNGSTPNQIGSLKTTILIPEPMSVLLTAVGGIVMLRRRR